MAAIVPVCDCFRDSFLCELTEGVLLISSKWMSLVFSPVHLLLFCQKYCSRGRMKGLPLMVRGQVVGTMPMTVYEVPTTEYACL